MIIILNLLTAIVFPLAFPLLAYLLSKVNTKPVKISSKNGKKILDQEISIALKQLPTSYLSNNFWVFTISINGVESINPYWIVYSVIMMMVQFYIIIYANGVPKKKLYYGLLIFFGAVILIATILKLLELIV
jgi:hypothetical protein